MPPRRRSSARQGERAGSGSDPAPARVRSERRHETSDRRDAIAIALSRPRIDPDDGPGHGMDGKTSAIPRTRTRTGETTGRDGRGSASRPQSRFEAGVRARQAGVGVSPRMIRRRRPGAVCCKAWRQGARVTPHGAGGWPHSDLPRTEHDRSAIQLASRPLYILTTSRQQECPKSSPWMEQSHPNRAELGARSGAVATRLSASRCARAGARASHRADSARARGEVRRPAGLALARRAGGRRRGRELTVGELLADRLDEHGIAVLEHAG
jgi:hypothetical protein